MNGRDTELDYSNDQNDRNELQFLILLFAQKNYENVINQYKKKLGKSNMDTHCHACCCRDYRGCPRDEATDEGSGGEDHSIPAAKHGSGRGLVQFWFLCVLTCCYAGTKETQQHIFRSGEV